MILSLRTRLMIGIAAGILLLLCGFSLFVYSSTRYALVSNFDQSLLNTAKLLTATMKAEDYKSDEQVSFGGQGVISQAGPEDIKNQQTGSDSGQEVDLEFDIRKTPEFGVSGSSYYCIYNMAGDIIIKSPSYKKMNPPMPEGLTQKARYGKCALPGSKREKRGRSVAFRFKLKNSDNDDKTEFVVVLSRDAGSFSDYLSFLKGSLLLANLIVVGLAVVIARFVAGRSLRPVQALGNDISRINANNLGECQLTGEYPSELRPMVVCLNSLLERLQLSFAQERRFTADVAHELRTPMAGLQSSLDVCLSRPRENQDYRQTMQDCLAIVHSMNRMVGSLLSMARLDTNPVMPKIELVILTTIIDSCWAIHSERAAERNLTFACAIPQSFTICSDVDYLTMILSNLLDNAVEYTNTGGRIWVTAESAPEQVCLSLFNTGCTITPENVNKVFNPFWQNDPSRSATGLHCGIGLTIVQKMVRVLNGQVHAEILDDGVFAIRINLPGIPESANPEKRY